MFTKSLSSFLIICLVVLSCKNAEKKSEQPIVTKVDYNQLKPYLEKNDGKTYVINFWATWCGPCVKELPYFEDITKNYQDKNVEVLLVSLDFPKDVDNKLIPFLSKKNIQSKVVLLDDANENFWINAIDSTWSGAIPATIIYNKSQRKFYEQSFTKDQLITELETFLKP